MVVVVSVVVMLLVLFSLVIAFVFCRLRDRHRLKDKEPELLTYCTTIDSLHKYWMVDLARTPTMAVTAHPPEPSTLLVRGRADGSSVTEGCYSSSPIECRSPYVIRPISPAHSGGSYKKSKPDSSCSDVDGEDQEVEVQVYRYSPNLCNHTVDFHKGTSDFDLDLDSCIPRSFDACSETVSTCHSVGTHFTNFTEMSTDFTKSCEGIPYIDDDFEFNCEDNLHATTRLCRSVDCLQTTYSSCSPSQSESGGGLETEHWSQLSQQSRSQASHNRLHSNYTSGTFSSVSGHRECDKMLGMHSNTAVISLSQMSISIRSCPNSPICKRDEENRIKRAYSKEYEGPFSFSETLLYCLPGVNMYHYSDSSSGSDPSAQVKPGSKPTGGRNTTGSEVASWEMRTPF